MALGTPTVTQLKKSASAPYDLHKLIFVADTYPGSGGFTAFQAFVRTALGRDVTIAFVKSASVLLSENAPTVNMVPTYDVAADKLYYSLASSGEEITGSDMTSSSTISLIVACF